MASKLINAFVDPLIVVDSLVELLCFALYYFSLIRSGRVIAGRIIIFMIHLKYLFAWLVKNKSSHLMTKYGELYALNANDFDESEGFYQLALGKRYDFDEYFDFYSA